MRNFIYLLFLPLISITACKKSDVAISCIPQELHENLYAFYPFTSGSIDDLSGNGRDLVNNTSAQPTLDRFGNSNCAFEFKNRTTEDKETMEQYLKSVDTTALSKLSGDFSVSLWYKDLYADTSRTIFQTIFSNGAGGNCPDRHGLWSLALYDCRRGVFGYETSVWDNIDLELYKGCHDFGYKVQFDKWHHMVATYDSQYLSIYKNGELQEREVNRTGNCSRTPVFYNINQIFIGSSFTGVVDDIMVFDKSLDENEVSLLYNAGSCCSSR